MNYNAFLDTFFSSPWYSFGTLLGLLIIGFIFRKPLYINRKQKFFFAAVYFVLFMLGFFVITMINPMHWGYGVPDGVSAVMEKGERLFVMDYQMAGGSEGTDPDPFHRINVIDKTSGEKLFRFSVGPYAEIILISDEAVVCRNSAELNFYSVNDGALIAKWNTETLPDLFPELKIGIDHFDPYVRDAEFPVVEITALDGKKYQLDLRSRKMTPEKNDTKTSSPPAWKVENDRLEKDGHYNLLLKGKEWADKRKQIYSSNDSLVNANDFFLEGKYIAMSTSDSVFVILHYENTTLANWILTGVSIDGKRKRWDIRQNEINIEKTEKPMETCWVTDAQTGILYFVSQNKIAAVQLRDGKIRWQAAL